jgi:hypothetical protein
MKFKDLHVGCAKAWTEYTFTHDQVYAKNVEDVSECMEINRFLKTLSPQELTNKKSGWRWVARLPLSIDMDLAKKGVYKSKAAFNRWKNDPDNAIWALSRDVKLINKGRK